MWIAANRDECAFEEPESFRLDRDPQKNLLWGAGIHVCPGAHLARLEMRLLIEEVLSQTARLTIDPKQTAQLAVYPASGFQSLPLKIQPRIALVAV
jgi:cytochrome P450